MGFRGFKNPKNPEALKTQIDPAVSRAHEGFVPAALLPFHDRLPYHTPTTKVWA
jgi:hypothetical protein